MCECSFSRQRKIKCFKANFSIWMLIFFPRQFSFRKCNIKIKNALFPLSLTLVEIIMKNIFELNIKSVCGTGNNFFCAHQLLENYLKNEAGIKWGIRHDRKNKTDLFGHGAIAGECVKGGVGWQRWQAAILVNLLLLSRAITSI